VVQEDNEWGITLDDEAAEQVAPETQVKKVDAKGMDLGSLMDQMKSL
jgi:hypothetical protein